MRPIDADAMREDWLENGENEYVYDANAVLDSIDAQPTVDVPRWIPVTERLPEKYGQFVCRYVFDREDVKVDMPFYQVLSYYYRDDPPHFQHEGTDGMKVTHWMPLPEPPEEDE